MGFRIAAQTIFEHRRRPTALTSPRARAIDDAAATPLSPSSGDDVARENAEARVQAAARRCRNLLRIIAGDGEPFKAVRTINDHR